jgi:putative spermidine/putrescine transport system permease protein
VPSIVHALGFYRMWIDLRLLDTFTGVILVHVVTGFPYVVITVSTALATFDPRLEQAARNLGASMAQALRLVIVPCIMPGILAGAVFAFVHSWDELVVLLFITSRKLYLLPRAIWAGINENVDPTIAAVATVLMLATLSGLLLERYLRRRAARGGRLATLVARDTRAETAPHKRAVGQCALRSECLAVFRPVTAGSGQRCSPTRRSPLRDGIVSSPTL